MTPQHLCSSEDLSLPGEFIYWSLQEIPKNPIEIVNTIMYQMPRQDQPHESAAVHGTAYGLMVYLLNNRYEESIPIMKWLQTQRNTDGGFAGPQVGDMHLLSY